MSAKPKLPVQPVEVLITQSALHDTDSAAALENAIHIPGLKELTEA